MSVSRSKIHELLSAGKLQSVRIDGCRRIPVHELWAYVARLAGDEPDQIAQLLGITPQRAGQIARDHADFPPPIATLAAGRVWDADAVKAWIANHPDRRSGRPRKKSSEEEVVKPRASASASSRAGRRSMT